MVLQELLKVEYKVIFVSSGAELASKGRELSEHFSTQGTPIMMGGGVLACVHFASVLQSYSHILWRERTCCHCTHNTVDMGAVGTQCSGSTSTLLQARLLF